MSAEDDNQMGHDIGSQMKLVTYVPGLYAISIFN